MDTRESQQEVIEVAFDNSFVRELPGFFTAWSPVESPSPELVYFNPRLAEALGLSLEDASPEALAAFFSGNQLPSGAEPIAQVYAGHQFGHFNPQLGDGRALILGEVLTPNGQRFDLNLKGSGKTPFSRGGDGKAALGPMLREVVISEAMHALGVPTTRALAATTTGLPVYRENILPGAVLTRVAASHIRMGTFQFFAARGENEKVKRLADYSIARHDPHLLEASQPYLAFLKAVGKRLATLVAKWMGLGFIHGVMNTDNMSIGGETMDYGPCAFMETYHPETVFSSIDTQGRYAYQNQPRIAQWNMARFAETLLPLLAEKQEEAIELATEIVTGFATTYQQIWSDLQLTKLGLTSSPQAPKGDEALMQDWLDLLQKQKIDFTLAWRSLADAAAGDWTPLENHFNQREALQAWLTRWQERCAWEDQQNGQNMPLEAGEQRAQAMRQVNPWLIPRNHLVEAALDTATQAGDLKPFAELMAALSQPYVETETFAKFSQPAEPAFTENFVTFCGT